MTRCFASGLNVHHLLGFNKVGDVSLIIDSTGVVPRSESVAVPTREESDGELFTANKHRLDLNDLCGVDE